MTAKIDQAWEILKGEGLQALGRELQRFFQRRIMAAMAWSRGVFQIQVESRVARFEIRSYGEALNWIRTYQTEEICLRHLIGRLRSADVFWDIGAYHGLYAILAAQFCRKVIAFEPYSQNARRIIMNTRLNGCQDRVRVLRIALSDREGPGFFDLRGGERAFMMGHVASPSDFPLRVQTAPGDALVLRGIPPPDVVKIDVEGHECSVLNGMRQILGKHVRQLICEVHASALARHNQLGCVERILREAGFEVTRLYERRTEYFVWAEKRPG